MAPGTLAASARARARSGSVAERAGERAGRAAEPAAGLLELQRNLAELEAQRRRASFAPCPHLDEDASVRAAARRRSQAFGSLEERMRVHQLEEELHERLREDRLIEEMRSLLELDLASLSGTRDLVAEARSAASPAVDVTSFRSFLHSGGAASIRSEEALPPSRRRSRAAGGGGATAALAAAVSNFSAAGSAGCGEDHHSATPAQECSICLANFVTGQRLVCLPCPAGHTFHEQCASQWFREHITCPLCRMELGPPAVSSPALQRSAPQQQPQPAAAAASAAARGGARSIAGRRRRST
eukprot:TRINITY_DN11871_c0_g1_i2.p1 TRINITY_DN11871_c0_g1~~TRINITY_DN11871_c0_g1_i2.p1  ORF type:complete len:299 (-),score=73.20 TRINITY_DN11871_c0_g1_i2:265-1161(-)